MQKDGMLIMMNYESSKEYLEGLPMWANQKNSLRDVRCFLQEMGEPDKSMKIFHVAGTNGKGSVCAFISSALLQSGYKVGAFVSPHLEDVRERFLINGAMITEEEFRDSCCRIKELSEKMMEKGFLHPTYFEYVFYMCMDIFHKKDIDLVILEAGLGGRIDITNVIDQPLVSIITSISMDHMNLLGDTIEKIAEEKAGIIKPGIPVIYDGTCLEAAAIIEEQAGKLHSPAYCVDRQSYSVKSWETDGIKAVFYREGREQDFFIPSQAEYQVINGRLAYEALKVAAKDEANGLILDEAQLHQGFQAMRWQARMEEVLPGVFLDGAHNAGGIEAFTETSLRLCKERNKRVHLLFSAVEDKEHAVMIRNLAGKLPLDRITVTHIDSERGLDTETLAEEFQSFLNCEVRGFDTVESAVNNCLKERDEDHLLFCVGSLYLMGEIKTVLRRNGL